MRRQEVAATLVRALGLEAVAPVLAASVGEARARDWGRAEAAHPVVWGMAGAPAAGPSPGRFLAPGVGEVVLS